MCRIRDASLDRHPEIHSTPVREDSSKNCGADQQRLQILDLHFDKFPTSATFACWKIRFKTKVCSCSQFPTEAMLWIKEVEMVESVDDLKFSRSIIGSRGPDFEVLDARIASELNRIIQNTRFKKVSLEQKKKTQKKKTVSFAEDRSLSWSTSISGSLEPMILSRILPTCSLLLFEMMIFRNLIRNGRVFIINDETPAWWHLGRIVQTQNTRVWETQDRIGIVWPGDSSEESWTLLSQIEDNSKKNYRAEFATEFWGQKRKLWDKRRGQESGDKTAWTKKSRRLLAVGVHRAVFPKWQLQVPILFEQVCKINTAESFSEIFCEAECKKMHREPEILEAEAQVREWLDCRAGICTYPFCEKKGILQNAWFTCPRVDADLVKKVLLCASLGSRTAWQMVYKEWWQKCIGHAEKHTTVACFKKWNCRSLHRFCGRAQNIRKPIRRGKFSKAVARHA